MVTDVGDNTVLVFTKLPRAGLSLCYQVYLSAGDPFSNTELVLSLVLFFRMTDVLFEF